MFIDTKGLVKFDLANARSFGFHQGRAAVSTVQGCGYLGTNGELIIPAKYTRGDRFSEGLAGVRISCNNGNGRMGYINKEDKMLIQPAFNECRPFSEGSAAVMINGKWGIIDRSGQFTIAPELQHAGNVSNGATAIKRTRDSSWQYVDKNGKEAIRGQFVWASSFNNGTAAVQTDAGWGIIDREGAYIIRPGVIACEELRPFVNGLSLVRISGSINTQMHMAYVNSNAKIVYEWKYAFDFPK
jgi:hypothetical protein